MARPCTGPSFRSLPTSLAPLLLAAAWLGSPELRADDTAEMPTTSQSAASQPAGPGVDVPAPPIVPASAPAMASPKPVPPRVGTAKSSSTPRVATAPASTTARHLPPRTWSSQAKELLFSGAGATGLGTACGGALAGLGVGGLIYLCAPCLGLPFGWIIGSVMMAGGALVGAAAGSQFECMSMWLPTLLGGAIGAAVGLVASIGGMIAVQAAGGALSTQTVDPLSATSSSFVTNGTGALAAFGIMAGGAVVGGLFTGLSYWFVEQLTTDDEPECDTEERAAAPLPQHMK